jgi:hypothetical protein
MNTVGYSLSIPDNGTFMFREKSALRRCPACGYSKRFMLHNPAYRANRREVDYKYDGYFKRNADCSSTYDSYFIVSDRFKEFCLNEGYPGLVFREFENDKTHFNFMVKRTVKFDAIRRDTTFEKFCRACKNYESVVGATPSYLLRSKPLRDGFYRTDLMFGSGDTKSPVIIVGVETKAKLERAKLKGLTFAPAFGVETS